MNKITNIFKILVGVVGAILFLRVFYTGDDVIEADASLQDSVLAPLMYVSYIILVLGVVFTLLFSIKSLFTGNVVKTLISLGVFVVVLIISYAMANGVETPMRDGEILSESGSRWVGTGLNAFYILAVLAVGAMLVSSVKKLITR
jgi:Na+/proline symporter